MKTNYDLIIEGIHALNIDTVFVYPGHGIISLLDKINEDQALRMIVCSCEQEAVAAADAYGRYNGAGVALVTYGVGPTSAVNQISNAVVSHSPLWVISGRPSAKERSGKFVWSAVGNINAYINMLQAIGCDVYEFCSAADKLETLLHHMKAFGKPLYVEIDPNTGRQEIPQREIDITKYHNMKDCNEKRFSYWITDQTTNFALPGPLNIDEMPPNIGEMQFTYDVGEATFGLTQLVEYYDIPHDSILGPLPWVTMGFAIPAAIGVTLVTHEPVVAITGDGSFRLSMLSLSTISRYNLPVKIIIIDNCGFETERALSEGAETAAYNDLTPMDYERIAEASYIPVYSSLKELLIANGPGIHIVKMKGRSPRMEDFTRRAIRTVIE